MGLFKKKDAGADDDSNRKALFGSRKEKAAPAASNPCMSQPSSINDTSDAQQTPPHPARTPTRSHHRSTRAPTTHTARTRRLQ